MIEAIIVGVICGALPLQLMATLKILYTLRDVENALLYIVVKGDENENRQSRTKDTTAL